MVRHIGVWASALLLLLGVAAPASAQAVRASAPRNAPAVRVTNPVCAKRAKFEQQPCQMFVNDMAILTNYYKWGHSSSKAKRRKYTRLLKRNFKGHALKKVLKRTAKWKGTMLVRYKLVSMLSIVVQDDGYPNNIMVHQTWSVRTAPTSQKPAGRRLYHEVVAPIRFIQMSNFIKRGVRPPNRTWVITIP